MVDDAGKEVLLQRLRGLRRRGHTGASLARMAVRMMDKLYAGALRRSKRRGEPQPECAPGCWACCHVAVRATAGEAKLVADHLTRLPPALFLRIHKKAIVGRNALRRSVRQAGGDMALAEQYFAAKKLPCPVLDPDTKLCLAYPVRPLECRAKHSTSAQECLVAKEYPVSRFLPQTPLLRTVGDTMLAAYREAYILLISLRGPRGMSTAWSRNYFLPMLVREMSMNVRKVKRTQP